MDTKQEDAMRNKMIERLKTLDGVGDETAGALLDAGFKTPMAVRCASDAELLTVPGLGQASIEKLRNRHADNPGGETITRKVGRREIEWNPHVGGPVVEMAAEEMNPPQDAGAQNEAAQDVVTPNALPETLAGSTPTVSTPGAKEKANSKRDA